MLEINTPAIGQGCHRIVYIHPLDNDKAIKIVKPDGCNRQSKREIKVYKQLIKKNHTNWKHLPKFYGEVATNRGGG